MRYTRHIGLLGALITSLAACGGSDRAEHAGTTTDRSGTAQPASGVVQPDRRVCPACAPRAGGETSDFGDGSDYFPGGAGDRAPPSPCELSRQASAIDLEAARALGFGAALDAVETTFDLPFEWSPRLGSVLGGGGPATGFTPETRLRGTTHVVAPQLLSSTLEGCEDLIVATLATELETADGALAIAGELHATLSVSGVPTAGGMLDLSRARGTLELDPPSTTKAIAGYVGAVIYFFSSGPRTELDIAEYDPHDLVGDVLSFIYEPIGGKAPIDACPTLMQPIAFEEPTAALGGASLSDQFADLSAKLHIGKALPARWRGGTETTVQVELGEPGALCAERGARDGVTYQVPLQVTSSDGRVVVKGQANASASYSAEGWVEIFDRAVLPADTFAESTGIQAVDFGGLGAAEWHTEVYSELQTAYLAAGEAPYHGEVTVEGVDDDGHVTGIPGAVTGVIEKLTW
jgi:hypothetical protein